MACYHMSTELEHCLAAGQAAACASFFASQDAFPYFAQNDTLEHWGQCGDALVRPPTSPATHPVRTGQPPSQSSVCGEQTAPRVAMADIREVVCSSAPPARGRRATPRKCWAHAFTHTLGTLIAPAATRFSAGRSALPDPTGARCPPLGIVLTLMVFAGLPRRIV